MGARMTAEDVYSILNRRIKEGGGSGTGGSNYNNLANKPVVNGVTLAGTLTLEQLGISEISNTEIEQILSGLGGL